MENKISLLRCMDCGNEVDLYEATVFRCPCYDPAHPKARGLYDVVHRISTRRPMWWKTFYDSRISKIPSGVWRFHPWIMPSLSEEKIVSMGEGIIPIVPIGDNLREWLGARGDVYIIQEGKCPSGSFKDMGMTVLVSVAFAAGIRIFILSSTGDTSASAAAYAASKGLQCWVILPPQVTMEQILQAKLAGARIIMPPADFDGCMQITDELAMHHKMYPANSLCPTRIEGHQATVFLSVQFLNWHFPDWYVLPVGNGSNCSSVGKALRFLQNLGFNASSRILGCQLEIANPLYSSWIRAGGRRATRQQWEKAYQPVKVTGNTIATAMRIGDPVSWKKVIREISASDGAMEQASEREIWEAWMCTFKDGISTCPQTADAIAGLRRAITTKVVDSWSKIFIISTADSLKFMSPFQKNESGLEGVIHTKDAKTETILNIIKQG